MSKAERLKLLLSPKSVAWIGGSGMAPAIDYMQANRFKGEVVAVNPNRQEIAGVPCVASINDLPFIPDLAILVIPKVGVVETVRALSHLGCGAVICITSGFSEASDGDKLQKALIEACTFPVVNAVYLVKTCFP